MPHYMIDCRIEIEAPSLTAAEDLADGISSAWAYLSHGLAGNPLLFIDDVRLTTGEQED